MITLLYFARLREALGAGSEQFALPPTVRTLSALRGYLEQRGGVWAKEMAAGRNLRAAINQTVAVADAPIADGDEVAFFPPVTGG